MIISTNEKNTHPITNENIQFLRIVCLACMQQQKQNKQMKTETSKLVQN